MPEIIEDTFEPRKDVKVTIYRQSPGGTLYAYYRVAGQRHRPNLGTKEIREAKRIVRQMVDEALAHGRVDPPKAAALDGLITEYLEARWPVPAEGIDKRKGNRTFQDHKSRLFKFSADNAGVDMGKSTYDAVVGWAKTFIAKRTNKLSARNDREVLRMFFKWLIKEEKVSWHINPCESPKIELPRETDDVDTSEATDEKEKPCSDEELKAFLPLAKKSHVWPVVVLCLGAGLRPAEALRVRWADIDWDTKKVQATNYKRGKVTSRKAVCNSWVMAELKPLFDARVGDTVFAFNKFSAFDMVGAIAGSVTLQRLRATACTRAILDGMPLPDYVCQFGHSLAVAQKHYLRLDRDGHRQKHMESTGFAHLT